MKSLLALALMGVIGWAGYVIWQTVEQSASKESAARPERATNLWSHLQVSPDIENLIINNEKAVIAGMQKFVEAQKKYHAEHGLYAANIGELDLPMQMIEAVGEGNGYYGYRFTLVQKNGADNMNYFHDFVICAYPVAFKRTGVHTFVIGPKGIVLWKLNLGASATNAAAIDQSWQVYKE